MNDANLIRQKYLDFFAKKKHKIIPRSLLVPQNDPSTLFIGSGMQPLIPYLLGEDHPEGKRLVDSQTCLRIQDIEEIGDNRHTTFFEMLGNWSLGNYFKKEQINWFFEFLTTKLNLDPKRLFVSCFSGSPEHQIPKDEESFLIWSKLFEGVGIQAHQLDMTKNNLNQAEIDQARIFFYKEKNWWCRAGSIQDMPVNEPGGPDTEVFYLFEDLKHDPKFGPFCHPNCDCGRYIEIGNSVFMEFVRQKNGFAPLPHKNVDFGGGLERLVAAYMDSSDVFMTSLFWPIIQKIERLSKKNYSSETSAMRVIADHLKGAFFLGVDGVNPSNKAQGYVMRRLLRRAIRFSFELGIENNFIQEVAEIISSIYADYYPEVISKKEEVISILVKEEKLFRQTLRKGLKEFAKLAQKQISGADIFKLYDTFGFPVELSLEEVYKQGFDLDKNWKKDYEGLLDSQRQRSHTATKGTFKGGLGGDQLIHKKYHTATHLMYKALREVLGNGVIQHGSNITEERLRFDFSYPEKMTPEQIKKVEDIVNQKIDQDLNVSFAEYPIKQALNELHAFGAFGDRYGDIVKVYMMTPQNSKVPYSIEICGGPHVEHTALLKEDGKVFKILKEESSSAGIRRIKAALI